jgi:micrococcal nuclease
MRAAETSLRERALLPRVGRVLVRVLASLSLLQSAALAFTTAAFPAKVIGISDGDTLTVLHEQTPVKIRLDGIDAPESGQAFGNRAKQAASALAFGQTVTVHPKEHDRYGRLVAEVILPDGRSLNQELVRQGWAWWFRRYAPNNTALAALESEAREARRGLWADPKPVPPREWRQAQQEVAGSPPVPLVPGPSVVQSPQPQATTGPIIGNRRSRVYHRPDCPSYAAVAPQNRVPFASPAEAEAAGYRLAGNCPR